MTLHPLLKKITDHNQVGSSYIMVGNNADTLRAQANALAKRLNCLKNAICDDCTSCKKIENRTHPDLHWILSNGEIIKIERLRELQKRIHLKRFEGKYQVIIIDGAEHLHAASSNSILKILEEPPQQTVFLLLTPHIEKLLTTIVSRCHIVRMPGSTQSLPDVEFAQDLLNLPEYLAQHQDGLFSLAQKIAEDDETFHDCLELWLAWYRTLLFYKESLTLPDHLFAEKEVLARNLTGKYSLNNIFGKIGAVLEAKKNLQYQVKRDLLAENLLIQLTA